MRNLTTLNIERFFGNAMNMNIGPFDVSVLTKPSLIVMGPYLADGKGAKLRAASRA